MSEEQRDRRTVTHVRRSLALWAVLGALLLLPLLAMQVTREVAWDETDFATFGAMLAILGLALELTLRSGASAALKAVAGLGAIATFLLVWAHLAVGIFPA